MQQKSGESTEMKRSSLPVLLSIGLRRVTHEVDCFVPCLLTVASDCLKCFECFAVQTRECNFTVAHFSID